MYILLDKEVIRADKKNSYVYFFNSSVTRLLEKVEENITIIKIILPKSLAQFFQYRNFNNL